MTTADATLLDRIVALEAENIRLRDALQHDDATAEEPRGKDSYDRLLKKYDDLFKAHRNLQEKHAGCKPYVDRATQKYRAAKEVIKQWQQFYDHQQRKVDRLHEASAHVNRSSSPAPGDPDSERTPRALPKHAEGARGNDHQTRSADGKGAAEAEAPFQLDERPGPHTLMSQQVEASAQRVTSSQTTQPGSDPAGPYDARLSSDDEPTFVSARPVKRRRANSPSGEKSTTQIKQERTSPSQPFEINSEDFSSPVLARRMSVRTETSNLDAVAGDLDAPARHRQRRAASAEATRPPRVPTMASSLSEGGGSDSLQHMIKEERESTPDLAMAALQQEGSDASDRALQPLSGNIVRNNRSDVDPSKAKRKREGRSKAKAVIVSEDGDMDSSQVHAEKPKQTPNTAVNRRLDSLLDDPTPQRHELARRTVPKTRDPRQPRQIATPHSTGLRYGRKSVFASASTEPRPVFKMPKVPAQDIVKRPINGKRKPSPERFPPPPDPEDEPLRSRPVIRLDIDDFRINPKYKGTDFAFADSIRGREQRRCLPGCTKPECCGDTFRKAVEMGVRAKKTDDEALEAYLGPNYENHMSSRSAAERHDILIKARTYAMASEYGKHRQAFKRRTTPPGFWRIDMPSTQEEEQDRAKAHEIMRQEVYDRWREAMVPGGRWKFRDE